MMMRLSVSVEARPFRTDMNSGNEIQLFQKGHGPVHRIQGYGWKTLPNGPVNGFDVGMFFGACYFPKNLHTLVCYLHSFSSARLHESGHSAINFLESQAHLKRP
jgi:hypothetical protein